MQIKSVTRFIRVSPDRARNVADLIRGLPVGEAVGIVEYTPTKAAGIVSKTLQSAIANAKAQKIEDVDSMKVEKITVDGGPIIRRFIARAMGRATRIRKRTAHITIILNEVEKKIMPGENASKVEKATKETKKEKTQEVKEERKAKA